MKMADQRNGLLLLASCALFACLIAGGADDVPDGVVYTDLLKTVQKGNSVILKCKFYRAPIAVYWKKADDPDHGTTLITWVEGTKHYGACANGNKCDIDDEFSLTIEDVQIADQGRYICRVSNYLGILIYNYTDVQIYAPPVEPFPVITGCEGTNSAVLNSTEHCTVFTSAPITITCSALKYYPDIDIFFLHGSKRISDTDTDERENIDGTKNKSISINGSPSKNPYICVASDVPGSQDQFTTTVLVSVPAVPTSENGVLFTSEATEITTMTEKAVNGNKSAKIAVPLVLIVVVAAVVASAFVWRARKEKKRRNNHHSEDVEPGIPLLPEVEARAVREVLSYELWLLAYDTPEGDMEKVRETLLHLDLECGSKGIMAPKEIYETLCRWKEENDVDHARLLKEALESAKFEGKWQQIYGIVSFYELWILIYCTKEIDLKKVRIMLRELGLKDVPEYLSKKVAYEMLCKWKEEDKNCEETKRLKDALSKADMEHNWTIMIEEHQKKCTRISRALLRHVIAAAGNAGQTKALIRRLVPDRFEDLHTTQNREDAAWDPMRILLEWSEGPFEENPIGLLSLALEKAGCSPTDRSFFAGIVSFYELWLMIYCTKEIDSEKIRFMLNEMGLEDVPEDLSKQCAYELLCKWKEENNSCAQTKLLKDAFGKAKIELTEKKKTRNKELDNVLEQLLKDIGHWDQIDQVITILNGGRTTGSPKHRNIPDALAELKEWSKGQLDEDPLVLLSCALEWTRISPLDRTFFTGKKMSFYELWSLAYATIGGKRSPLHCLLGCKNAEVAKQTTYEALWKWKEEHKYEDQMQILKDAMSGTEDADILRVLCEHEVDTFPKVPTHTLHAILHDVDSLGKTEEFLHKLCPHQQHGNSDASGILEKWNKGPFNENPVILLSTALEKAGCEPVDRSFFTVPENLQHPISQQEVKDCVLKLTGRHSTRLAKVLSVTDKKKLSLTASENNQMLFDTESMILESISNMKCSNYAKRCRLDDTLTEIGRHDMRNCFGTTEFLRPIGNPPHNKHPNSDQFDHESAFDDDVIHMMEYLPKESKAIFSKIPSLSLTDDEKDDKRFDEGHQEEINIKRSENKRHVTMGICIALFDEMLEGFKSKGQKRRSSLFPSVSKKTRRKSKGNQDESIEQMIPLDMLERYRKHLAYMEHNKRGDECISKEREHDEGTSQSATEEYEDAAPMDGNGEEPVEEGQMTLLSISEDGTDSESLTQGDRQDDALSSEAGETAEKADRVSGNITLPMNQNVVSNDEGSDNERLEHQHPEIRDPSYSKIDGAPESIMPTDGNGKEPAAEGQMPLQSTLEGGTDAESLTQGERQDDAPSRAADEPNKQSASEIKENTKTDPAINGNDWKDSNPEGTNIESKEHSKKPKVVVSPPTSEDKPEDEPVVIHKTPRSSEDKKTYYETRRKLLAPTESKDCVLELSPAKYIYEAELIEAAFGMLMRDVLPLIKALGKDLREVSKYKKPFSTKIMGGSVGLLLQLREKMKKFDNRRLEFCLALQYIGYFDVASLVYFDYKPSISELYNRLTDLWEGERRHLAGYLLSKDDIAVCTDSGEINHVQVMRQWRNKIRPTPYNYRVHFAAGLREVGRKDIAEKVLSGQCRKAEANVVVLKEICSRLTKEETKKLCKVLNLKQGNDKTEMVITVNDCVCKHINKLAQKGANLDKQKERRNVNKELIEAGFYELAEEIMILEFGFFSAK